jgi:hypothetical protein
LRFEREGDVGVDTADSSPRRGSTRISGALVYSSLLPTISPDSAITSTGLEIPLSIIDGLHPADILDEQLLTVPYTSSPKGGADQRLRGYSVSNISTDGSANLQLRWSSTTATSSIGSGGTTMSATSHLTLPGAAISSPSLSATLGHTPVSRPYGYQYPEAEMLVPSAQQSILDMVSGANIEPLSSAVHC